MATADSSKAFEEGPNRFEKLQPILVNERTSAAEREGSKTQNAEEPAAFRRSGRQNLLRLLQTSDPLCTAIPNSKNL